MGELGIRVVGGRWYLWTSIAISRGSEGWGVQSLRGAGLVKLWLERLIAGVCEALPTSLFLSLRSQCSLGCLCELPDRGTLLLV